jgi:CheY-like chemotaxis protein
VLLVEDAPDVLELIRLVLTKLGLEVDSACDGKLACEKAVRSRDEGRPYDLVLMDIQMPEMDGHNAVRHLRRNGWQGPVVALTAHALRQDREKCLEAGCDDYLPKPLSSDTLKACLKKYLPTAD